MTPDATVAGGGGFGPLPTTTDYVLDLAALSKPLDVRAVFGREAPLEIEVGIGSGYFLTRYAQDHPEVNLIGIDNVSSEVYRSADKCRRLGIPNTRVLRCDAPYFLNDYPADGSVFALHIYYSDPWPKRRHHKRRLWKPSLTPIMERVLRPGGDLFLKTDVTELFDVIRESLAVATRLTLVEERRLDLEPMEGDYQTNFQRKAIAKGHPLHYQHWRRAG